MEGRNNLFWKVLFSLLIMAVYGSVQLHMQLSLVGLRFQQGPVNMKEPEKNGRMSRYAIHQNRMTVILM